jgi:hypothetical protein
MHIAYLCSSHICCAQPCLHLHQRCQVQAAALLIAAVHQQLLMLQVDGGMPAARSEASDIITYSLHNSLHTLLVTVGSHDMHGMLNLAAATKHSVR